jgi:hypothetical protein
LADIFVSYTSSDRHWAFWIGHELEALGHVPHIDEWEISGGGDIMAWMEERHQAADHILCIISTAYLIKPYSSWERRAAQWAAARDRPGFALPVFVEHCETKTLFSQVKRCNLYGVSEEEARARLKAFLEPAGKPAQRAAFPGSVKYSPETTSTRPPQRFPGTLSNVPISVPRHFMGRDDAVAAIETALKRYEGRVAITALHGLRGVGKTTLAAAYAERRRGDYGATWWIRAQAESTLRADLVALGIRLGWVGADDKEKPAVEAMMERLRHEGEAFCSSSTMQWMPTRSSPIYRSAVLRGCWSRRTPMPGEGWRRRWKSACGPRRSAPTTLSFALAARRSAMRPRLCRWHSAACRLPTSRPPHIASGSTFR